MLYAENVPGHVLDRTDSFTPFLVLSCFLLLRPESTGLQIDLDHPLRLTAKEKRNGSEPSTVPERHARSLRQRDVRPGERRRRVRGR